MYYFIKALLTLALGFYFRRIERFHGERVPLAGPVLFASNHPGSLTDSFLLAAAVSRKVNFIGTAQLFRFAPLKWVLSHCGVIPINRFKDDPRAMRTVAQSFEACYRVLERGEAVGIFPEGITYDDAELKEVKSGAARMALELEQRHGGQLGLQLVPVGLTLSAKERYRSEALVHFGEPLRVARFLEGYADHRKECIQRLTAEIARRIQELIVHLPALEHARVVDGVKRLYLERRDGLTGEAAGGRADDLVRMQAAIRTIEHVYRTHPQEAATFAARLDLYEKRLARLRISDESLAGFGTKGQMAAQSAGWSLVAVLGAPVALYGWAHRLLPFGVVRWAVRRFPQPDRRKAQAATTAIVAGTLAFVLCYGLFVALFHHFFGWPASLWYALSLPPASLLAHYYWREVRRLVAGLRNLVVLLRAPLARRRLLVLRAELVRRIEHFDSFRRAAPPSRPRGEPKPARAADGPAGAILREDPANDKGP